MIVLMIILTIVTVYAITATSMYRKERNERLIIEGRLDAKCNSFRTFTDLLEDGWQYKGGYFSKDTFSSYTDTKAERVQEILDIQNKYKVGYETAEQIYEDLV